MKRKFIYWFNEINMKDIAIVGGKAASLGEMFSCIPVPEGFCISTHAYKDVLQRYNDEFAQLLNKRNKENSEELENIVNMIKNRINAIILPKQIEKDICINYKKLGTKVAVRSSATCEDLADASFAGAYDTFLNVEGENKVIDAVKKCWASLFNARAICYREKNNFKHNLAFVAVVVQKMLKADVAGVTFTVNPINKSKDEMIIEACFGLGEKLVSGEITPDTFIINKNSYFVKQEFLSFKKKTLTRKEIQKLSTLAKKIEQHYKKPMDIEWAIKKKKIFILQARPITTM